MSCFGGCKYRRRVSHFCNMYDTLKAQARQRAAVLLLGFCSLVPGEANQEPYPARRKGTVQATVPTSWGLAQGFLERG